MATGWSAAQIAWMKQNDPNRLAQGYKASGANAGQGTLQGGSTAASGSTNPYLKPEGAGKPLREIKHTTGKGADAPPMGWKAYGALPVNKDLKWEYDQGNRYGTNSYEEYLQLHWKNYGSKEYRIPLAQKESSGGGGGGRGYTAPAAPVRAPFDDYDKDDITAPASGLEDTIKTSPSLLRERRRRSYLTRG